jgi:membrane protease YdiL (CAAX protease family)
MPSVIQFIFTVVFGFLWWWVYNRVGAALEYLVILGSVLAVCVCCCRSGVEPHREWSFDRYLECIRRCWLVTVVLMVGLFILAILVAWVESGAFPGGSALVNMLIAAIGAPLFVRLICCAYENAETAGSRRSSSPARTVASSRAFSPLRSVV